MAIDEQRQRSIPTWTILVDGSELEHEVTLDVLSVEVEQYVDGADAFSILVNAWNNHDQDFQWLDDGTFAEGKLVEVRMGYSEEPETLLTGEIVSLEVEYGEDMPPVLRVEGYDKLHRFRRGRRTRVLSKVKDSQVAERIAEELCLRSEVDDSEVVHDYLFQYNRSDLDFLRERGRGIHFELDIADGVLSFRKCEHHLGKSLDLVYGQGLRSLVLRLSTLSQVSKVVVKGWNPATKEAIVGLGQVGDESTTMGGSALGASIAEDAFGASKRVIVDRGVASQTEADQMAKSLFERMSLDFVQGEGEAVGDPALRAGLVVEIRGLGQRHSGPYYLVSTHHVIDDQGYVTRFNCRRNATS